VEEAIVNQPEAGSGAPWIERRALLKGVAAGLVAAGAGVAGVAGAGEAAAPGRNAKGGGDPYMASDNFPLVQTLAGKLRGYVHQGIYTFKGIPYGDDTGGANRFLAPRKPAAWAGVRSAMQYGPVSPQPPREGWRHDEEAWMFAWNDGIAGEDCLRLNIWSPGNEPLGRRPVMVWIHGGGFTAGCGQEQPGYDGESLARSGDVVVVSLNHRLGAFGYLNLARFGDAYRHSGNAGMLDIVLALEWVRDNIAAFGGDPGKVTIFGQSGGGSKVCTLLTMPRAAGLFHRAIVQSGAALLVGDQASSAHFADEVLKELGDAGRSIEILRTVAPAELAAAGSRAQARLRTGGSPFTAGRTVRSNDFTSHVDGDLVPHHPFDQAAPPLAHGVPLLVGTVLNEQVHALNHPEYELMSEQQARAETVKVYGAMGEAVYAAVRKRQPALKPFDVYSQAAAGAARARALWAASLQSQQGGQAHVYWFTWQTPVLDGRPRAFHCAEIAFAFNNSQLAGTMTGGGARAVRLAERVSQAWVNFARHGTPNHAGLPDWPAYSQNHLATMVFDDQCRVVLGPDRDEQDLIREALKIT
jgi:para-nitrobenzyl esterase